MMSQHASTVMRPLNSNLPHAADSEIIALNDATGFNPPIDVVGIEPYELADLKERHATLGDETTDESLRYAESFSESCDVQ